MNNAISAVVGIITIVLGYLMYRVHVGVAGLGDNWCKSARSGTVEGEIAMMEYVGYIFMGVGAGMALYGFYEDASD